MKEDKLYWKIVEFPKPNEMLPNIEDFLKENKYKIKIRRCSDEYKISRNKGGRSSLFI